MTYADIGTLGSVDEAIFRPACLAFLAADWWLAECEPVFFTGTQGTLYGIAMDRRYSAGFKINKNHRPLVLVSAPSEDNSPTF